MSGADDPHSPDRSADSNRTEYATDLLSVFLSVSLVALFLFAVSGVWPPLVAVESESMSPNVHVGDLVFVMDEERFPGSGAHQKTGVVTAEVGTDTGYGTFNGSGDVIVFAPDGNEQTTPIIHRAMFWVNESENWYDEADPTALGSADDCEELANCPAPHAGFVTKGDNPQTNARYDQVRGGFTPVKSDWIVGTAEARVPWLGCLRLRATGTVDGTDACGLNVS